MNGFSFRWLLPLGLLSLLSLNSARNISSGSVKEPCYGQLGCFSNEKRYSGTPQRPLGVLPWSPEKTGTNFYLQTTSDPKKQQIINPSNLTSIKESDFQTTRKTTLLVHGLANKGRQKWMSDACKSMLLRDSLNCIAVDWSKRSKDDLPYLQVGNNVRVVGSEIAFLIKVIQEKIDPSYDSSNYHLIGHGVGAHAAGEAGKRTHPRIGRITGLDPASPLFDGTSDEVSLDPSDACFVDVIHTSTNGVGIKKPIGHHNFYPNGGKIMPGCLDGIKYIPISKSGMKNAAKHLQGCNHNQAISYFMESIQNCSGFLGFRCDSYDSFLNGSCFPCPQTGCSNMGFCEALPCVATRNGTIKHQTYYLNTGSKRNQLPSWRYKASVLVEVKEASLVSIDISLFSLEGTVERKRVTFDSPLTSGTYSTFFDLNYEMKNISHVTFKLSNYYSSPLIEKQIEAVKISIQRGIDGRSFEFCPEGTLKEGMEQTFYPC